MFSVFVTSALDSFLLLFAFYISSVDVMKDEEEGSLSLLHKFKHFALL